MNTIHTCISFSPNSMADPSDHNTLFVLRGYHGSFYEFALHDLAGSLQHYFPNTDKMPNTDETQLIELVERQMKDGFVEVHLRYEVHEAECWEGWKWSAPGLINGPE